MNKLNIILVSLFFSSGVASAREQDSSKPAEKTAENPSEKPARRLKGNFKGHPISPLPDSESEKEKKKEASKPQPAKPSAPRKQLVIDNTLIQGGATKTKGKPTAPPPVPPPSPVQSVSVPPSAVVSTAPVDLNGNGEAYWRAKAKQVREHLAQAQQQLEAAQLEEKREENDFYAWDDGQYRDNVIKPAWDKSKEETVRAQEELSAAQKAVDNLDDDARKAGAYPGWIRE